MSFRRSLPVLALLVLIAGAAFAEAPAAPAASSSAPEVASCPVETVPPALDLAIPPPFDFLLCSCANCREKPDEICQISPDGYSIECYQYLIINHCRL